MVRANPCISVDLTHMIHLERFPTIEICAARWTGIARAGTTRMNFVLGAVYLVNVIRVGHVLRLRGSGSGYGAENVDPHLLEAMEGVGSHVLCNQNK